MVSMHEFASEQSYADKCFLGAIQGIDLTTDKGNKKSKNKSVTEQISNIDSQFMFGDPSDYSDMSEEEREAETSKMLSHWRGFSLSSSPKA